MTFFFIGSIVIASIVVALLVLDAADQRAEAREAWIAPIISGSKPGRYRRPREGFLWAMRTRSGLPLSGSDGAHWTRFRLFGLIPVARLGGSPDHARPAFCRYAAEAIFWTPAAMLLH
ncbi:MAG: hypothetical protein J7498_04345 [Sphingobium sp.]|nr:hypothetical protein [Sphingobium sp.]